MDYRLQHAIHCFDYVRQGIQCAGDSTLEEGTLTESGELSRVVWGRPHLCNNWDYIWKYAEEHQ
jgi:Mycotoxin biosynthesis protein UstYa